jgi:hypothetical protein
MRYRRRKTRNPLFAKLWFSDDVIIQRRISRTSIVQRTLLLIQDDFANSIYRFLSRATRLSGLSTVSYRVALTRVANDGGQRSAIKRR